METRLLQEKEKVEGALKKEKEDLIQQHEKDKK